MMGLTGLATDVLSVQQLMTLKCNMYRLEEHREMRPETFAGLLSTILYEKRYALLASL
jgi:20S proteasome subunit beta 3